MTPFTADIDLVGNHSQGRKERGGRVNDPIVSDPFDIIKAHGLHRLSSIKGQQLIFFIHA